MTKRLTLLLLAASATVLFAQEQVFELDPARSHVEFKLDAALHTVHGQFRLKSGKLRFNSETGEASGELVMDPATGKTGNDSRDSKMRTYVLEVSQFPAVVFTPEKVIGKASVRGNSQVQLQGTMMMHGQSHPMTLNVPLAVNGKDASADVPFTVPYVEWGLKNPSTFLLRVSKEVEVVVHAVGTLSSPSDAQLQR